MKKSVIFYLIIYAQLQSGAAADDCETLGHDWQMDAGILICSRCGAVDDSEERAAIEMAESKAPDNTESYAAPSEPTGFFEASEAEEASDEPDFEKFGIVPDMKYKEVYPFTTGTRDMSALSTTGDISVTEFGVLPADEEHPGRDGYNWCYVLMQSMFSDTNARTNGVKVMALCDDYYNTRLRGTTQRLDADGFNAYTVIFNGEEAECRYKRTGIWSDWMTDESGKRVIMYSCMWELEIPEGYDGTVVGLYSSDVDWEDGAYIDEVYSPESFRLFRVS